MRGSWSCGSGHWRREAEDVGAVALWKEMTAVLAGQPSIDSTGWRPVLVNSVAGALRRFGCGIVETLVDKDFRGVGGFGILTGSLLAALPAAVVLRLRDRHYRLI